MSLFVFSLVGGIFVLRIYTLLEREGEGSITVCYQTARETLRSDFFGLSNDGDLSVLGREIMTVAELQKGNHKCMLCVIFGGSLVQTP